MNKGFKLILSFFLYYLGFFSLEKALFGAKKAKMISLHRVLDATQKAQSYDSSLVISRENFEALINYLSKKYDLITMDQMIECINKSQGAKLSKRRFPGRSCVLTFDDGYRDNYLNSYPTLKNLNAPATIFVTADYMGKDKAFWQETFFRLMSILYEKKDELSEENEERLSCLEIRKDILKLFRSGDNRFWEITKSMVEKMKGLPQNEIVSILNELIEISREKRGEFEQGCQFLSLAEIEEMSQNRIDFSSHTLSHVILTVETKENAKFEIERSKQVLEEKLGKKINHLAYPNGDFNAFVKQVVRECGFASGSSIGDGCVDLNSDLYELSRNYIHDEKITNFKQKFSPYLFEFETSFILGSIRKWIKDNILPHPQPQRFISCRPDYLQRKIKILYLIGNLGHGKAGTEGHLITILRSLDRDKFEPFLCCLNAGSWLETNPPDCPVLILDFKGFHNLDTIAKIIKLKEFIRNEKIDLLHAFFVDANVIGILASRLAGVKRIISCRRNLGYSYLARELFMLKIVNPFVTRFLANSRAVKKSIAQKEKIDADRIDLIYNGVDLNQFERIDENLKKQTRQKLNLKDDYLIVGLVANLRPIKNIELFIQSAALVLKEKEEVYFVIVGQGPSMDNLKKLSQKLGIEDRVIFVGHCNDIIPHLAIFDIGVLSSDSEGFSNSILEYMAAKLPVVATEVGGNSEAIVHTKTGFLVKPKNQQEMSKALLALLNDNKLRAKMGAEGRKRVEEKFTLNHMMEQLGRYYYSLMANR